MATFVTPTTLRLTQGGVVNLDFLSSDNTARLTQSGVIGNGKSITSGEISIPVIMNQLRNQGIN